MGLQAKTVAQAIIRHWLTIFYVPAVICSDRGSPFFGSWFKSMCKHMGIRHAKTVAYHSWSNGRAEVAGRQMFEKFHQLHFEEPGRNSSDVRACDSGRLTDGIRPQTVLYISFRLDFPFFLSILRLFKEFSIF